jgi:hypothetical protein
MSKKPPYKIVFFLSLFEFLGESDIFHKRGPLVAENVVD